MKSKTTQQETETRRQSLKLNRRKNPSFQPVPVLRAKGRKSEPRTRRNSPAGRKGEGVLRFRKKVINPVTLSLLKVSFEGKTRRVISVRESYTSGEYLSLLKVFFEGKTRRVRTVCESYTSGE